MTRTVDLVSPLVALAQAGIPTDIQDLLVNGDPTRGIAPGALDKAITAYLSAVPSDVAGLVERSRDEWRYDIQYGPEGEANYAWVYSGKEMVATCKTHHAIAIVNAMNDATALSALASRPQRHDESRSRTDRSEARQTETSRPNRPGH